MSKPHETNYGKGWFPRNVDRKKYDENWIRIFGKECPVCRGLGWDEDINGNCELCKGIGKVAK